MSLAIDFHQHVRNGTLREERTVAGRDTETTIECTRCHVTWERSSRSGRRATVAHREAAVWHVGHAHPEVSQ